MRSITTFFFIFLFIQIHPSIAQKPISFMENGKWGYKDKGKVIVPAIYDAASDFFDGYAMVTLNHQIGYIDVKGKVTVPIIYEAGYPFESNMIPVKKNGLWGYVDIHGKSKTEFIYHKAWPFYSPIGAVVQRDDKMGCIDKNGKTFIPLEYNDIGIFSEDLVAVQKDSLYGYVDIKNNLIIPFQFQEAYYFLEGFAFAMNNGKYGMIDKTGKWIILAEFDNFLPYDYLDLVVMERDGKYEIWNYKGVKLTENIYTDVVEEFNSYLRIYIGGLQGIINSKGEILIEPEYSFIEVTEWGTITIGKDGKFGAYDIESKTIILPVIYDQVGSPEGGDYYLTLGNKQGLYNVEKKKIVVEPIYDGIEEHSLGYYLVFNDGKVGLVNPEGKLLLEPKYSYIDIQKKKTIVAVTIDEVYEYYTLEGKKIEKK